MQYSFCKKITIKYPLIFFKLSNSKAAFAVIKTVFLGFEKPWQKHQGLIAYTSLWVYLFNLKVL